tara:strand:+ start:299 stop:619 length:321 start_codon:yes stop_codon:yes gene_type:complete
MKTNTEMKKQKATRDIHAVMDAVSRATDVSVEKMLKPGRCVLRVVDARAIAIYLCSRRRVKGVDIAEAFGRSSPCVTHSCAKVEDRLLIRDKATASVVQKSEALLN